MGVIEIHHLSKSYGRSRGIEDLSLEIRQGDIFGFIGPNGAGKSTTIRILLNLIFPTSGSATIFGLDVVRDSKAIRHRTGYVPSDARMYHRMTAMEFLKFGAAFYGADKDEKRIRYLLDLFDLDPGRKIDELSMGNKKKVSIIQALIHSPELLILDEPTQGLDPLIQSRFFDLMREENLRGTTVFFSSHTLSEVQAFCKTVGIVRGGKIVNVEEIASLRKKQLKKVQILFPSSRAIEDLGLDRIAKVESGTGTNLVYMMLLGSIYSIVLTSNILLKEEYDKTAEYLMSRPLSRREIFMTKFGLAFLNILLLNLFATLVGFIAIMVYKTGTVDLHPFPVISFYTLLLNLLFGTLGIIISVLMKRARPVTAFCVGLVMLLYFIYTISRMSGVDGAFGYISPFKWVNVNVFSPSFGLEPWRIAAFFGMSALLITFSGLIYRRKDILT